jgi:hypothetical protein
MHSVSLQCAPAYTMAAPISCKGLRRLLSGMVAANHTLSYHLHHNSVVTSFDTLLSAAAVRPSPTAGSTIELRRPEAPAQQQQQGRTDIGFTRPPVHKEDEVRSLQSNTVIVTSHKL